MLSRQCDLLDNGISGSPGIAVLRISKQAINLPPDIIKACLTCCVLALESAQAIAKPLDVAFSW